MYLFFRWIRWDEFWQIRSMYFSINAIRKQSTSSPPSPRPFQQPPPNLSLWTYIRKQDDNGSHSEKGERTRSSERSEPFVCPRWFPDEVQFLSCGPKLFYTVGMLKSLLGSTTAICETGPCVKACLPLALLYKTRAMCVRMWAFEFTSYFFESETCVCVLMWAFNYDIS